MSYIGSSLLKVEEEMLMKLFYEVTYGQGLNQKGLVIKSGNVSHLSTNQLCDFVTQSSDTWLASYVKLFIILGRDGVVPPNPAQ
ncbi:hypothetical protein C5167_034903, partial [Papaver somniferum]